MRRSRRGRGLARLRRAFGDGAYVLTRHAHQERVIDELLVVDIQTAVLTGQITRVHRGDPRGVRYTVVGTGTDGEAPAGVVVRFAGRERCRVLTVFRVGGDGGE